MRPSKAAAALKAHPHPFPRRTQMPVSAQDRFEDEFTDHPATLHTKDFLLRPQMECDVDYMLEYQSDPRLTQYFGGPINRARTIKRLNLARWHYRAFGYSIYTALRKPDYTFAGFAGLIHLNFDFSSNETEFICCLTKPHWHHQLARQLTYFFLNHAFGNLHKDAVIFRFEPRAYPLSPLLARDLHLSKQPLTTSMSVDGDTYDLLHVTKEHLPAEFSL
ncbi:GNAT family N-acetyltransferase [Poriferisphaera sp. WC338]|uniref:GNAT family N-acetyltransferase n=1 Tax=Poriferisphaera sp. WC338 TaxID=3425129 RepID=UPI003D819EFE